MLDAHRPKDTYMMADQPTKLNVNLARAGWYSLVPICNMAPAKSPGLPDVGYITRVMHCWQLRYLAVRHLDHCMLA